MSSIKKRKHLDLHDLLKRNKNAPAQGTVEWKTARQESIGGSEMALFMPEYPGNKPYGGLKQLALQKLNINTFQSSKQTRWGNLCEEVTRLYGEIIFKCEIKETGSIPTKIAEHKYSPDGLGIVNKKRLKQYVSENVYDTLPDYAFVLFEFKNPFSRVPNGIVPAGYQIQVKTGLDDLPETDVGIFIDTVLRRCSIEQLFQPGQYSKDYFNDVFKYTHEVCVGFIGIYKNAHAEDEFISMDENDLEMFERGFGKYIRECLLIRSDDEHDFIDFGNTSEHNFDVMTKEFVSQHYRGFYTQPDPNEKQFKFYTWLLKFEQFCKNNGHTLIGIMPWKMFRVNIIQVEKEIGFIKQSHIDKIKNFVQFIRDTKDLPRVEQLQAIDRQFQSRMTAAMTKLTKQLII